MGVAAWLIDKSAFVRLGASPDAEVWAERIQRGLVHVTTVTRLEIGYSARSLGDFRALIHGAPLSAMLVDHLTPSMEDRALAVLEMLAAQGDHRGPSLPDLLIAAAAEKLDLIVLHVDADFERIAQLTGQRVERLRLG